jgi:hypothetical protein
MKTYYPFLRWLLLFALIGLGTAALIISDVAQKVYDVDITKLTFLIYSVFIVFSVKTGIHTYQICKESTHTDPILRTNEVGWFASDMLLTLGMIGTVAGFIYMLSTSFAKMDPQNVISMRCVLTKMSAGMSTALYTTAAGLVCSLLLKLQLFNLLHFIEGGKK